MDLKAKIVRSPDNPSSSTELLAPFIESEWDRIVIFNLKHAKELFQMLYSYNE